MIAIVDYRAGNLTSVKKAFDHIGAESIVTSDPDVIANAEKIVLPGVGHFAATEVLATTGMKEAITDGIKKEVPFLGICVGMQWLFETSEESPETKGLGIFPGQCQHFPLAVKSPHVGWNDLTRDRPSQLLVNVAQNSFVYFTHPYRAPVGSGADCVAVCRSRRRQTNSVAIAAPQPKSWPLREPLLLPGIFDRHPTAECRFSPQYRSQ